MVLRICVSRTGTETASAFWNRGMSLLYRGDSWTDSGSRVRLCAHVIHTVAPLGDGLVATVVLQGPVKVDAAHVYRLGSVRRRPASPVESDGLDQFLDEVEDAIRDSPVGVRVPLYLTLSSSLTLLKPYPST